MTIEAAFIWLWVALGLLIFLLLLINFRTIRIERALRTLTRNLANERPPDDFGGI